MLIGIGTDIMQIDRISPKTVSEGDPFLMRAYTEAERAEAMTKAEPLCYYADRFAGKEAVFKAISACGAEFRPGEIEILGDGLESPCAKLFGKTKAAFEKAFGTDCRIFVSLSYDTDYAAGFAVAEKF